MVAGWGLIEAGGMESSPYLQDARLTVLGDEECKQNHMIQSMFDPTSMQCAFAPGKDACQGEFYANWL